MTNYPLATSSWDHQEIEAINDVIKSNRFTMGEKVFNFEKEFSNFFGSKDAVMVNSGSSANLLMLSLLKWKLGLNKNVNSNIIVPAVAWSTTFFPVSQNDFVLNIVDVDPQTFNIDINKIEQAINKTITNLTTKSARKKSFHKVKSVAPPNPTT